MDREQFLEDLSHAREAGWEPFLQKSAIRSDEGDLMLRFTRGKDCGCPITVVWSMRSGRLAKYVDAFDVARAHLGLERTLVLNIISGADGHAAGQMLSFRAQRMRRRMLQAVGL
jgi:hypothetical protein